MGMALMNISLLQEECDIVMVIISDSLTVRCTSPCTCKCIPFHLPHSHELLYDGRQFTLPRPRLFNQALKHHQRAVF